MTTNSTQIERIRAMERDMNSVAAAVHAMETALEQYEEALPQLARLAHYYESPLWMQDYDDDNAGKFPGDLCRGVLTEDALYDLLGDADRVRESMARLVAKNG